MGCPPWMAWIGCARSSIRRSSQARSLARWLGVVLEQRAEVGVGAGGRCRRRRRSSRRPSSSVRRRSNSSRRAAGSRWRQKATRRREGAVVADVGVGRAARRAASRPRVGDAVDLLAPAGALDEAALAHPGPEGGQLAGERAGHRGRRRRVGALLDRLDRARRLEPGEGRVERAEADRGAAGRAARRAASSARSRGAPAR